MVVEPVVVEIVSGVVDVETVVDEVKLSVIELQVVI